MAVNSETEINLKTLQRVDSNIIEIIDHASQVAIYKFERKLNNWEGTDIEGTLFLYRRSLYPFHGFIIVNRMSTTNFVEVITSDMEFLLQEPYFLYKKSCGEIIGSWFYEEKDFRRITNKIQSIVLKQTATPRRQRCSSDSDSQLKIADADQDIMSMLNEAHTEYIKANMDEQSPEKNIEMDFNNLTTYTDKKINNKSLNSRGKETYKRSASEQKHLASPRRRFLSTGSYDSTRSLPLTSNHILTQLVSHSKETAMHADNGKVHQKKNESNIVRNFPFALENVIESAPITISSLFSLDENMPIVSGVSILDQSVEPIQAPLKSHISNCAMPNVTQTTASSDYKPNFKDRMNNQYEYTLHSSDLKETVISHLKWDSNIMLKIHEAYVASLKSLFIPKEN